MLHPDEPFCTHHKLWIYRCRDCEKEIISTYFTELDLELIKDEYKTSGKAAAIRYIRELRDCGLRQGMNLFESILEVI